MRPDRNRWLIVGLCLAGFLGGCSRSSTPMPEPGLTSAEIKLITSQSDSARFYVILTSQGCGFCNQFLANYWYHKNLDRTLVFTNALIYENYFKNIAFGPALRMVTIPNEALQVYENRKSPIIVERHDLNDERTSFSVYENHNIAAFEAAVDSIFSR